ncbi:MAG: SAM-dependent methyltransferase [Nitrospira sp.]|nr:SAM-dependent methyltransferase [Nitrospira sp.]
MFTLDQVVPWGRSFDEYCSMFAIDEADFSGRILGCGDGPASFNADATRRGASVVSCDPIYRWSAKEIGWRIDQTYQQVLEQTRQNQYEFVWDSIQSVEELGRVRMAAMQEFLADFPEGATVGRYIEAELPSLPFDDAAFDLALCSHLLFLYGVQLGEAFHHAAVMELCRVAREVRIFPLLALGGAPSPFIEGCVRLLRETGREVVFEQVPYEFQRGGNQMMRVHSRI